MTCGFAIKVLSAYPSNIDQSFEFWNLGFVLDLENWSLEFVSNLEN
jgi:hypothetical protein